MPREVIRVRKIRRKKEQRRKHTFFMPPRRSALFSCTNMSEPLENCRKMVMDTMSQRKKPETRKGNTEEKGNRGAEEEKKSGEERPYLQSNVTL